MDCFEIIKPAKRTKTPAWPNGPNGQLFGGQAVDEKEEPFADLPAPQSVCQVQLVEQPPHHQVGQFVHFDAVGYRRNSLLSCQFSKVCHKNKKASL